MNDRRQGDQVIGGLVRPLGQGQPTATGQQEGQHVNDFAFVKRVEIVERKLLSGLADLGGKAIGPEIFAVAVELRVESRSIVFGIGRDHACVGFGCRMKLNLPIALGRCCG